MKRFAEALADRVSSPAEVLDFGCGTGEISIACSREGYRVRGVDQSARMVEQARLRETGGVSFETIASGGAPRIPYGEGFFDAVIASSVLEYVADPARCFGELRRVCRPEGWLFCTVPNVTHRSRKFERSVKPFAGLIRPILTRRGKDWLGCLRLSVQRHPLFVWQMLLRDAGWSCESVQGHESPLWLIEAQAF